MCPWVGKVVDYDEDEDCATPYHVWYVDDGDEEWLSAEEVYNHRISAERATLLRGAVSASKDSGKCSVTSADLKMRATLSTRAGYDPTHSAVTHKDEGNKYHGTAGIVIKVEGTKKGRTITVRWADGVERPYTTKQLEVVGSKVNTDWDLRSIVFEGTITTSALKIKLMVYIGGIPYSLVGTGSGKYEAAPFVREEEGAPSFFEERKKKKKKEVPISISKDALHFDTAELLRSIDKGEVKWFYPEAYRAAEGSSKRDGPTETPSIGWNPAVSDSESDDESTSSLDDMIADNYEDPSTRSRPCKKKHLGFLQRRCATLGTVLQFTAT